MADARSTYDETNEVWPYFLLTLFLVVLLPLTATEIARFVRRRPHSSVSTRHAAFQTRLLRQQQAKSTRTWIIAAGWIFVAFLVAQIRGVQSSSSSTGAADLWDPYEILKVSRSATVKEIKSAYRKLSLEFHPDKVRDTANQAREEIEAVYVEITKAYRALTDDDTRENFLLHGHPDGPQPVTHGIALPAFLFNPAASSMFIVAYLVGFGLGIPMVVSAWWNRSQKRTRRGLLQASATQFCEMLVKEQPHFINRERILRECLTCADLTEALTGTSVGGLDDRRKLLESYLHRENDAQSHEELIVAMEMARVLLALHAIAVQFKNFELCQRIIDIRRSIIQAVPFDETLYGEYLQLRGADYEAFKQNQHKPDSNVLEIVKKSRDYLPRLSLLRAKFKVRGEENVTVNSQLHLELKFLVLPVGETTPQLSEKEIDAVSAASEIESYSSSTSSKFHKSVELLNKTKPELGPAVAPHFPVPVNASWLVYMYGMRDNKLIEDPYEITNMDLHNLTLSSAQIQNGDNVVIGTVYIPFSSASPPQPVSLAIKVAMLSTTYFGADVHTVASMQVVEAAPLPSVADELDDDVESSDEEVEGLSDLDTSTEEELSDEEDEKNEKNEKKEKADEHHEKQDSNAAK